jgi:ferredoxin
MKKPVVELSDCILCGICEDVCPEVFKINDARYVEVSEMADYPLDEICEVISDCPANCIHWEES